MFDLFINVVVLSSLCRTLMMLLVEASIPCLLGLCTLRVAQFMRNPLSHQHNQLCCQPSSARTGSTLVLCCDTTSTDRHSVLTMPLVSNCRYVVRSRPRKAKSSSSSMGWNKQQRIPWSADTIAGYCYVQHLRLVHSFFPLSREAQYTVN